MPIGLAITGRINQFTIRSTIAHAITGIAINAAKRIAPLDIKMAASDGYIIADASGIIGVNAATPGARDASATLVRDSDGNIAR